MHWEETGVMDRRMSFIAACVTSEESVSGLCRQYGVSRKTGHKWLARYRREGAAGLSDRSRAPRSPARAIAAAVAEAAIAVRHRHPSWGRRKIKAWLEDRYPEEVWPAASTIR